MKTEIVNRGIYQHTADGKIARDGDHFGLNIHIKEKTPHWKHYGKGHANIEVNGCAGPGWLSIDTQEFSEKSGKRTMITLDRDDVVRLRDLLNLVLGNAEQK